MRLLATIFFTLIAGFALADTPVISGSDDAAYVDARDSWLDGDDLASLGRLKTLAEAGNTAAQILLARIAEEPHLHRHVTGDMARAERIELLRQPGGLSGTSWLKVAAPSSELATALVLRNVAFSSAELDGTAMSPEATAAVQVLLNHGETALATEVAFKLIDGVFYRETLSLLDKFGDRLDPISQSLRAATMAVLSTNAKDAPILSPEDELALARIYPWEVLEDQGLRNLITRYAELVPAWKPLRDLCESSCAPSYDSCLLAGGTAIGYSRRFPFSSPLQSLISDETYWNSARIRGDAARFMTEIEPAFEAAMQLDQCFGETVTALAQ